MVTKGDLDCLVYLKFGW